MSECTASGSRMLNRATDRLLKSFNSWAFKREQPTRPDMLARLAQRAVRDSAEIEFVLYWGKGPRSGLAAPDLSCLDYLASMADRIQAAHQPGASMMLLLTDTHARLNGHSSTSIDSYFTAIDREAALRGFRTRRLSAICDEAEHRFGKTAPAALVEGVLNELTVSANKWYRGPGSAADGALAYYTMNQIEKVAVERCFPHAVFVTFNNRRLAPLFPEAMPIFYMYSLRKGFAVKPWFLNADGEQASIPLLAAPAPTPLAAQI